MPEATLTIEKAGWSTVQDLGRFGYSRYGVTTGGSSDQFSARCANALVANRQTRALIEVTALDFVFTCDRDLLVAVTGASCELTISGNAASQWRPLSVHAGSRIEIRGIRKGLRIYVAINGVIEAAPVLGSVAPDQSLGIGKTLYDEGELRLRSDFRVRDHPFSVVPLFRPVFSVPRFGSPWVIDVVDGPESHDLWSYGELLTSAEYSVEPQSDTVGLRLCGETPVREGITGMLSRGVAIGAIEIPSPGSLLVLMRSRLLTAGYPVIAVATTAAQSRLGQVRPGDSVRFRRCTLEEASKEARKQQTTLRDLERSVEAILEGSGISKVD